MTQDLSQLHPTLVGHIVNSIGWSELREFFGPPASRFTEPWGFLAH